jgi:Protein of unknown function (DUF935)
VPQDDRDQELALAAPAGSSAVPGGQGAAPPGGLGITSQGFGQEGYILGTEDVGPLPKPPPEESNFSVGVPYYLPFATPYRDSWEIFRDDPVTVAQLVAMRRQDGQARALYRLLTMPVLAALKNCNFIPPEGQKGGEAEAQFAKDMFTAPSSMGGMTHTFSRFMRQVLLAVFDGFAAFELVYWVPSTGPNKGKITLRKIDWRPSETITHLLDGQGEWDGLRQRTFFQGRTIDVKIPRDRAWYFAVEEAERPFYGVSLFESAFYHWDKKAKLYFLAHLAAQRSATGLRVGTMPPNPAAQDKNNFVNALAQLGLAQYMVVPSGDWTVQVIQEVSNFDFLGLINHHNSQMSKSVLQQWFDDQQGSGGDTTLVDFGRQDDEAGHQMLEGIMEDIRQGINTQIIPRFIDWNFGSGLYPTFEWGTLTEEQQGAIQDTFDKLAAAPQSAVTPEFMLALEERMAGDLGFNIDYDAIRAQQAKQQALQQQQQEQMMQGGGPGMMPPGMPPGAGQQQPGGAGQSAGQQPGQGSGGQGGSGYGGNIPPDLLPEGFGAVRASMGELLNDVLSLSGGPR